MNIPTIWFVFFCSSIQHIYATTGYYCVYCKYVTNATTVKSYVHHLHYWHGLTVTQKCMIGCGQLDCSRTFDSIQPQAVRMHVKRHVGHSTVSARTRSLGLCHPSRLQRSWLNGRRRRRQRTGRRRAEQQHVTPCHRSLSYRQ